MFRFYPLNFQKRAHLRRESLIWRCRVISWRFALFLHMTLKLPDVIAMG